MRWAEIKAVVSDESSDLVTNILIEEGCGGAAITGPSVRASGPADLSADLPIPEDTTIMAYLPVDDRLEGRLEAIRTRIRLLPETGVDISPGEITVRPVDEADWANAWKSFFKPVLVGRVMVKPSWEDVQTEPEQVVVEIDPGMAFGTGNHPTTQLCLLALQNYVKGGERVLDVGTGSGVLAIAAAKLGASEVHATENDPVAAEAAEENVSRNSMAGTIHVYNTDSPGSVTGQFDIVVANITADTIKLLTSDLESKTRDGGILIASGLIESRADEVILHLMKHGFELTDTSTDDEWVALVMKKVEK